MDLPDCPPGAEGYQDTVVEMPKKHDEDSTSTKAEIEFKEHLSSLKIKVEDGSTRCMVERRGRDVAGKWIYLCYPCAAVCSGESILQTHISGKKHKCKLALRNLWPTSIFEEHPYIKNGKTENSETSEKVLQKMADVVSMHNIDTSALDGMYGKFRRVRCHIQDTFDKLKTPLLGVEYLVEFPPDEPHHEPSYVCLLCNKQGAPRTIVNHMVCHWHRIHYLWRHFPTTHGLLHQYRNNNIYREGVGIVMNRLVHRIEETYGRLKPLCIEKDDFNREKEQITQWVFKGYHFSEKSGNTFVEVVDFDLINSLAKDPSAAIKIDKDVKKEEVKKDPSPPVVAAPTGRPQNPKPSTRRERRPSADSLSDLSLDELPLKKRFYREQNYRDRPAPYPKRFSPGRERDRDRERERDRNRDRERERERERDRGKSERVNLRRDSRFETKLKSNLEYKMKMAADLTRSAEEAAGKTLAYHEKNPEKHPLYPEEWKRFWNKRYKELQTEGKDPSKHDFKPEWIVFWTKRMKVLHDEELGREIAEIHRKLNLPEPEDRSRRSPPRRSPPRRSPPRRSPPRRSPPRRSPPRQRSRSPIHRNRSPMPRREPGSNPYRWRREDHINKDHINKDQRHEDKRKENKRSLSPLSLREARMRQSPSRSRSRATSKSQTNTRQSPMKDTVLISDDELKPDDGHSPWGGSVGSLDSLGSLPDARSPSHSYGGVSRDKLNMREGPPQSDAPDDVVSSLRLFVALEDYLGSLGPKLIDLLTLALKMEKEKPNSSEQLLENELSISLIETAKEKLKGAVQAGLVTGGAAAATKKAVTRAAALLHEADKRANMKKKQAVKEEGGVAVAGVGAVDKAAIAKQMAAALIAQGKTDVTSEELAQLVEAVVGMAEAKKREVEKATTVVKPSPPLPRAPPPVIVPSVRAAQKGPSASAQQRPSSSTQQGPSASALQLLQSAYDENEKKAEAEETPDVMDGLSDSDLKTLLQNFAELSAEEQHGLIAYLKKLEAKDHRRVEKLREYVSAAVSAEPSQEPPTPVPAPMQPAQQLPELSAVHPIPTPSPVVTATLSIDSEDDDYTVEEVFKSAAKKVKEDQRRQEMEAVKKLLSQETKLKEPEPPKEITKVETAKKEFSAANLLALMQATMQSSTKPVVSNTAEAKLSPIPVQANSQPKLFGDKSEEVPPQNIIPSNSPLGMHLNPNPQHFGNTQNYNQQNFANQQNSNQTFGIQAPMSSSTGSTHRPDQDTMEGSHSANQDYGDQNQMGGFHGNNQPVYGNESQMGGQDGINKNLPDYGNQHDVTNQNQPDYRNQHDVMNQNQPDYGNQGPMGGNINSNFNNRGAQNMNNPNYQQADLYQQGDSYQQDHSYQQDYQGNQEYGQGGGFNNQGIQEQGMQYQQENNQWAGNYNGGNKQGNYSNFDHYGGGAEDQRYPHQQYNNDPPPYKEHMGYGRGNYNNFRGNNTLRGGRGRGGRGRGQRGGNFY